MITVKKVSNYYCGDEYDIHVKSNHVHHKNHKSSQFKTMMEDIINELNEVLAA